MTLDLQTALAELIYPVSDGEPMADNTEQFQWIVTLQGNLDALFSNQSDVFVAGDLLWYPVEALPTLRRAPDTMVVFGRPKGYRGAYLQWKEGGIAPQVVFEVLSPGNTKQEMLTKFLFYEMYGVEEFYLYDPDRKVLRGWLREGANLRELRDLGGWVSPRLGIRFVPTPDGLELYYPDGEPFRTFGEIVLEWEREQAARKRAEERAKREQLAREQAEERAKEAELLAERFAAKLRELGIDPGDLERS